MGKSIAPQGKVKLGGIFIAECYDKHGNFKWDSRSTNLVTDQGLQNMLDVTFTTGGTKQGTWYLGLTSTGPTFAAANTMGTHAWTESTDYAETTRPAWTETRSSQTLTNSAAKATFTINKDSAKFGGAFLCSTKARGTTKGIIMSGSAFSGGDKTGDSGDKLQVTYTFAAVGT
jgi:hypothetical protein